MQHHAVEVQANANTPVQQVLLLQQQYIYPVYSWAGVCVSKYAQANGNKRPDEPAT